MPSRKLHPVTAAAKACFEAEVKRASEALKAFPRQPNGLTPDAVKNTEEWRLARAAYDAAFKRLQRFNSNYLKTGR